MNPIIEKIQKLLRLASNNTNQAEMESAMAKAIELATLNDIELSSIDINKEKKKEEIKLDSIDMGQRLPITNSYIGWILQNHFGVKIILWGNRATGRKIYYVGTASDIEMAKFVANFLSERFMSLWYQYRRLTNAPISSREAFFVGLYRGLNDKLKKAKQAAESTIKEQNSHNYALMIVNREEALKSAVAKYFSNLKTAPKKNFNVRDSDAFYSGMEQGNKLNIARPIGN